jgi:hypothetical protein
MKATTTITAFINSNLESLKEQIAKALCRDSCYSTIIAWDPSDEKVIAWHADACNSEQTRATTEICGVTKEPMLIRLWSGQFESIDGEDLRSEVTEYLEDKTRSLKDFNFTFIGKELLQSIIENGITAITDAMEDGELEQTAVDEALKAWDARTRPEYVELIIDSILDDLGENDRFQKATNEVYKIISPENLRSAGVKTFSDDGDGPYEDTTCWIDLREPLNDLIEERFDHLNEMIGGFPDEIEIEVSVDDDTVFVKVDNFELLRFVINL